MDIEFDNKTDGIVLIDDLPRPQRETWYCPECERIYVLENGDLKKRYVIDKKWVDKKLVK